MFRLTPVNWKKLDCVFKKAGFALEREAGSHRVYSKPGVARPVIIPKYTSVGIDIIKSNLKSAGIVREEYFRLLSSC
ncbi:MAG: type II toxin-antitoxin system HicA family toxin [Nitrospinae bacterium]|nr:type II toxin-antitoxin system HicA family toxin [Nitrospinota bacterium]